MQNTKNLILMNYKNLYIYIYIYKIKKQQQQQQLHKLNKNHHMFLRE